MVLNDSARVLVPPLLEGKSLRALAADVERAISDSSVRTIVLEGRPGVFCRGLDPSLVEPEMRAHDMIQMFADCLLRIRNAPKPVLAVVDGETLGGGLGIAAASDLLLAGEEARFGLTEVLFGLVPAVVLPFVLERVAPQKVRLWALAAATYSAEEARQVGLVDEIAPSGELSRSLRAWQRRLARANPASVGVWKDLTTKVRPIETDLSVRATAQRLQDPDVAETIRRFLEEGKAPWI